MNGFPWLTVAGAIPLVGAVLVALVPSMPPDSAPGDVEARSRLVKTSEAPTRNVASRAIGRSNRRVKSSKNCTPKVSRTSTSIGIGFAAIANRGTTASPISFTRPCSIT